MDARIDILRELAGPRVYDRAALSERKILGKVENIRKREGRTGVAGSEVIEVMLAIDIEPKPEVVVAFQPGDDVVPIVVGVYPTNL